MSMKATCPACGAYLSVVWEALEGGRDSCPSCGLPAETLREVEAARKAKADADLAARYEEAVIRAGKAEAELAKLRAQVLRARSFFGRWAEQDPLTSEVWKQAAEDAYREELSW